MIALTRSINVEGLLEQRNERALVMLDRAELLTMGPTRRLRPSTQTRGLHRIGAADLAAYRSRAIAAATAAIDLEIEIREAENALGCDIAYVRQLRAILESARYPRAKIVKEMRRRMAGLRTAVDEIETELVDAYERPTTT
jgi:hypothetical protein